MIDLTPKIRFPHYGGWQRCYPPLQGERFNAARRVRF